MATIFHLEDTALLERIRKDIIEQQGRALLSFENINSIGIGYKCLDEKGEVVSDEYAIQVTVDHKVNPELLQELKTALVPPYFRLGGMRVFTDVLQRSFEPRYQYYGRVREATTRGLESLKLQAEDHVLVHPGMRICNVLGMEGSVGAIVYDKQVGTPFLLTNYHLLQGANHGVGDLYLADFPYESIAILERGQLDETGDYAIARFKTHVNKPKVLSLVYDDQIPDLPHKIPLKTRTVNLRDSVVKYRMGVGLIRGKVQRIHVLSKVRDPLDSRTILVKGFEIQTEAVLSKPNRQSSLPGDSGSLWLCEEPVHQKNQFAAGLHFAGDIQTGRFALASYLQPILDQLEVTFDFASVPSRYQGRNRDERAYHLRYYNTPNVATTTLIRQKPPLGFNQLYQRSPIVHPKTPESKPVIGKAGEQIKASPRLAEVQEQVKVQSGRSFWQERGGRQLLNGAGHSVAVIDTGLFLEHQDFQGTLIPHTLTCKLVGRQIQLIENNLGEIRDRSGHGTHIAGILVGSRGIAPGAGLVPIKVIDRRPKNVFPLLFQALKWVWEHGDHVRDKLGNPMPISVISLSLGNNGNYTDDTLFHQQSISQLITQLAQKGVAMVVSSGNSYALHQATPGMAFPAILRDCISVGAVFDSHIEDYHGFNEAVAYSTGRDRIVPFSQRLPAPPELMRAYTPGAVHLPLDAYSQSPYTTIFAPGAYTTSSSHQFPAKDSIMQGTSQAAPVVAGAVLILQQLYRIIREDYYLQEQLPVLPKISLLKYCLIQGGELLIDGDDEDDNVAPTNGLYKRLDIPGSLQYLYKYLKPYMLNQKTS